MAYNAELSTLPYAEHTQEASSHRFCTPTTAWRLGVRVQGLGMRDEGLGLRV